MDCNYNFTPEHCAFGKDMCFPYESVGSSCFCNTTLTDGVRIVHAYGKHAHKGNLVFMQHLFQMVSKVKMCKPCRFILVAFLLSLSISPKNLLSRFVQVELDLLILLKRIEELKSNFSSLPNQPLCFFLTAEALYRNAEGYLRRVLAGQTQLML